MQELKIVKKNDQLQYIELAMNTLRNYHMAHGRSFRWKLPFFITFVHQTMLFRLRFCLKYNVLRTRIKILAMTKLSTLTIPSLFYNSVKNYAGNTSLVFSGEENYTYQQMGDDVKSLAQLLKDNGVQKGDKVAILSTNMPNWGKSLFAISLLGCRCSNFARFS